MMYKELKGMSQKDLAVKDQELRFELFNLKIKAKTQQLENKSRVRAVRRDIARVQTRLSNLDQTKGS